ncbi:hypothetical protein KIW84_075339 [Lathyrus oleraceus]|uniref:Uncharacterized protein n=1 Tax=Pisum sativum TaxID=3888 RepID=A0A9D4VUL3_PEA|nr:hypothetical protein KIW84_075339 [Pisum sativum]
MTGANKMLLMLQKCFQKNLTQSLISSPLVQILPAVVGAPMYFSEKNQVGVINQWIQLQAQFFISDSYGSACCGNLESRSNTIPSFNAPIPDSLNTLSEFINRMEHILSQNGYGPNISLTNYGDQRVELPSNTQGLPTLEALTTVLHRVEQLLDGQAISALSHIAGRMEREGTSADLGKSKANEKGVHSVANLASYPLKNPQGQNLMIPVQPVNFSFRPCATSDMVGGNTCDGLGCRSYNRQEGQPDSLLSIIPVEFPDDKIRKSPFATYEQNGRKAPYLNG